MNLETKYFGSVEVKDVELLHFEQGLPGFKDLKKFALLPLPEAPVYHVLQSADEKEIAFIVANPYLFFKDYEFTIDDQSKGELALEKAEDVELYSILTLKNPFEESTVNLQAPVVINKKNRQAKQLILNRTEYHTKHSIKAREEAGGTHAHP
ncbi:flagellar assembly protein FliW [Halobacillus fulvus]|nr:flagellar assembly protein FliW [Halobacillus fulvus]